MTRYAFYMCRHEVRAVDRSDTALAAALRNLGFRAINFETEAESVADALDSLRVFYDEWVMAVAPRPEIAPGDSVRRRQRRAGLRSASAPSGLPDKPP